MAKELGADRALVASDQAPSGLGPPGFDHGYLSELVAKIDAADRACPCRRGAYRYEECPTCGATSSHPCGPVLTAESAVVSAVRQMLQGANQ